MRYRGFALGLAVASLLGTVGGCIEDTDCGICDPENLVLQSISGLNYAGRKVHVVSPQCEGERCPAPFTHGEYFVEDIGPCEQTEEALESADPNEFCKLSPLLTDGGLEFVFNNLLDPMSIELVRKRPDNPQLFEVYDWKSDILAIQGPITRYNGDYAIGSGASEHDAIDRVVNLACIDNLSAQGIAYDHTSYADPGTDPCNQVDPGTGLPRKRFEAGSITSYRGRVTAFGNSCSTPESGHDSCCSYCDWLLTTKIERYGVDFAGTPRSPNPGTTYASASGQLPYADAVVCRTGEVGDKPVDKYQTCRDFIPAVDRSDEERTWEYAWCAPGTVGRDCPMEVQQFKLPQSDLLRETHPDLRPAGLENLTARCSTTAECGSVHDLDGTECMGLDADGLTCLMDAHDDGSCSDGVCRPQWFVTCSDEPGTVGPDFGYCVDRRFSTFGSAACFSTTSEVENRGLYGDLAGFKTCDADGTNCTARYGKGQELSRCDWDENGELSGEECCVSSLYGPEQAGAPDGSFVCDPYYQSNIARQSLYERDQNLPGPTRECVCPRSGDLETHRQDLLEDGCLEAAETGCFDEDGELRPERAGRYAVKFVERVGGVVYDPAAKGVLWRPADRGGVPRAAIETCAYSNTTRLIGDRNRHDGWRAHDGRLPETDENFDRAMCSGSKYRIVFNEPGNQDNPAYVQDKVGNTLEGKAVYEFETPQFHVVPGSGSPTDNLRIGACGDFSLRFSNKYDLSPVNLSKLQIWRVECETVDGDGGLQVRQCVPTTPNDKCPDMVPAAGGPGCAASPDDVDECTPPCLTIDVENHGEGIVTVEVDPDVFGKVLDPSTVYRLSVPAADTLDAALSDPAEYQRVFWDVCGMPLVREGATLYEYDFMIDQPKCSEDKDNDGAPLGCDNAEDVFNPLQGDMDHDGVGDVVDLCPLLDSDPGNQADTDDDGIGNACDNCTRLPDDFNEHAPVDDLAVLARNNPNQIDSDGDGIGDVCDNCIWVPNCGGYGDGEPAGRYRLGMEEATYRLAGCQRDGDEDMIGDACDPDQDGLFERRPGAAGDIGYLPGDDLDQDGITNMLDGCPRIPLDDRLECASSDECPTGRACNEGLCNHLDSDDDGVGNLCDTCPYARNPNQVEQGSMQDEDPDRDFVGSACEAAPNCAEIYSPRRMGFHWVQQHGYCCTVALIEAEDGSGDLLRSETCDSPDDLSTCTPLTAPHPTEPAIDIPVRRRANCSDADEAAALCRALPPLVETAPGIVEPPDGCEEALAMSPIDDVHTALENVLTPLTEIDFAQEEYPLDALWQRMCLLPSPDQDFDGHGDKCDLCELAFDPENLPFVDDNNKVWFDFGKYCNGDYDVNARCELMGDDGEPDPGDDESGSSDGGESGSSGGGGSTGG